MHWSLDDWPHLHWKPGRGDAFTAPQAFLETWLAEFESAKQDNRHVTYTMHPEVIGRGYRAKLLDTLIERMSESATTWFATARRCGSLRRAMTFPVHRSTERNPRERGEAFGRAQAEPIAKTLGALRADVRRDGRHGPGRACRSRRQQQEELEAIARGANVDAHALMAVNARTEILAGHGPTECSVVGAGGLLAQNWDWHPESATVIQIVEHDEGWFVTLTEAGILAKIGLNDAGLGVCLNLLRTDRRRRLHRHGDPRPPPADAGELQNRGRGDRAAHERDDERQQRRDRRDPRGCGDDRALTRRRERDPRRGRRPHEPLPGSRRRRATTRCRRSRRTRSRGCRPSATSRCSTLSDPTTVTRRASAGTETTTSPGPNRP